MGFKPLESTSYQSDEDDPSTYSTPGLGRIPADVQLARDKRGARVVLDEAAIDPAIQPEADRYLRRVGHPAPPTPPEDPRVAELSGEQPGLATAGRGFTPLGL